MHCYICDKQDDLIQFDKATQEYGPCSVCMAVIQDCLDDFAAIDPVPDDDEVPF
jgi:hypothetical protein